MKHIFIALLLGSASLAMTSCESAFLDLEPLDSKTDVVYFKRASDFQEYTNSYYGYLQGWSGRYGSIYDYFDCSSDLSTNTSHSYDIGHGTTQVGTGDSRWDNCYANIRTINILLQKAGGYANQNEIKQPLGESYFFRAYSYFYLLKFFGGVPIVTTVMDTDSPELHGTRNSRYEVVDLILSDLDKAIENLKTEAEIPDAEKGRITKYAAEAFKARVLLYEATWRKYNGTTTDFKGSTGPAKDQVNDFLDESIRLSEDVIKNGGYQLWNYNSVAAMNNQSNRYLFCIDGSDSNPAGKDKTTNREFIIYGVYDVSLRPGTVNLNEEIGHEDVSRKFVDMFVCKDGLPISKSAYFKGYKNPGDEFLNRDYRLKSYVNTPSATATLTTTGRSGYSVLKFRNDVRTQAKTESANYPVLRLAEVYLNYAEALYERNGKITDEQLNTSINMLRNRAGVASLTNALVSANGLDMLEEIRRERTVELFMEGFRFDDLKRWGKMEEALNASRCGMVVGGSNYPTYFKNADGSATDKYKANAFPWGEEAVETPVGKVNCIVLDSKDNCNVTKKDYLWPIPGKQVELNSNLVQNPGY